MKSIKYITILVCNACFLAFVKYATDDPIHRLLAEPYQGRWLWYSYLFKVLLDIFAALLLLGIWVAVKKNLRWKPSVNHRIFIAIGITLIASAPSYWKCYDEWVRTPATPDRHAMAAKMHNDDMTLIADGFTYEEYALLRRRSTWHDIPESAFNISLESNSFDRMQAYPTLLNYYLPKGTVVKTLYEMKDVEPEIIQEIEDMGDSIRVQFGR